jgi:hypothetical protein
LSLARNRRLIGLRKPGQIHGQQRISGTDHLFPFGKTKKAVCPRFAPGQEPLPAAQDARACPRCHLQLDRHRGYCALGIRHPHCRAFCMSLATVRSRAAANRPNVETATLLSPRSIRSTSEIHFLRSAKTCFDAMCCPISSRTSLSTSSTDEHSEFST